MPSHRHAVVVGKFAPLHRGHERLLDTACAAAEVVTVVVWSNPDFQSMPSHVRGQWVRELYPKANVIVPDDGPPDASSDAVLQEYVRQLLARHDLSPDVVVAGDPYGPHFARHLGVDYIGVDRASTPEWRGTVARADVHASRQMLDPRVYRHFVEKVVFMGAESTGKSTLAATMAHELDTVHVAEYGRDLYEDKQGVLDLGDYVTIARVHRDREDVAVLDANRWLFVDTNAVTTMFFSHYYGRGSLPELRIMAEQCRDRYQHVVVCDDDIPFEQDGWRDNIVWRGRMQGMVLHDLDVRRIPYTVVSGPLDERVAQVKAILAGEHQPRPERTANLGPKPSSPPA